MSVSSQDLSGQSSASLVRRPLYYSEPTPAWMHSYGLDFEGKLKRGDVLTSRRNQILYDRLESNILPSLEKPKVCRPGPGHQYIVMDVEDPAQHSAINVTQTEAQEIGRFAAFSARRSDRPLGFCHRGAGRNVIDAGFGLTDGQGRYTRPRGQDRRYVDVPWPKCRLRDWQAWKSFG